MADLIDRQKAIDEILRLTIYDTVRSLYEATVSNKYEDCYEDGVLDAIDVIVGLTSPQPERKTGRWIHDGYDFPHGNDWIHCSVCGQRGINVPADLSNFCPNCGAKMEDSDG